MDRKITTVSGMSVAEGSIWWLMIMCTCGLAYPAYRARKHKLDRTARTIISE
jgi:hypothetical protein